QRTAIIYRSARRGAPRQMGEPEIYVVGNEKVEPAIPVKIDEGSTDAPTRNVGAGFCGDIGECAVPVVAPHLIVAEIRDVEIDPSVIVEVRSRNSHAISLGPDPAFFRDVNELERASAIGIVDRIIAVKPATQRQLGMKYGLAHVHGSQHCALDNEHVEVAVVVVVEKRNARPHRFRIKMRPRHPVEMNKIDSGFFGSVAEDLFRRRRNGERNPTTESRSCSHLDEAAAADAIAHDVVTRNSLTELKSRTLYLSAGGRRHWQNSHHRDAHGDFAFRANTSRIAPLWRFVFASF